MRRCGTGQRIVRNQGDYSKLAVKFFVMTLGSHPVVRIRWPERLWRQENHGQR